MAGSSSRTERQKGAVCLLYSRFTGDPGVAILRCSAMRCRFGWLVDIMSYSAIPEGATPVEMPLEKFGDNMGRLTIKI